MARNNFLVAFLSVTLVLHLVLLGAADIVDDLQLLTEDEHEEKSKLPSPPAARCFYKKQAYDVGATFADATCTQLCTCLVGGHLRCTQLCASVGHGTPACSSDSHLLLEPVPSRDPSGRCKCHRPTCVKRSQKSIESRRCIVDGKEYKTGDKFADSKCAGWCQCLFTGNVVCEHLCPSQPRRSCGAFEQLQRKMVASRDRTGRCKCARQVCELRLPAQVCELEGKHYNVGEKFSSSDCTKYCSCQPGGFTQCTSMCPPMASPMCSFDSHLLIKEFPGSDPSGRCKCQRSVCAPQEKVENGCRLEGQLYKPNEEFIDQKCAGQCRCLPHGGVMCFPLCPRYGVMCTVREQLIGRRAMDKEGRCFCNCSQSNFEV